MPPTTVHRLCRWIAKCGLSQHITADKELGELLSRILKLCKARFRYELPSEDTVHRHLQILGRDGKAIAHDFLLRLLASGCKVSITGDLWSEGGMGLFGVYAHGMPKSFEMEKMLIGLVACESDRHTVENISDCNVQALRDMGLTPPKLVGVDKGATALVNSKCLTVDDLKHLGLDVAEDEEEYTVKGFT